MHNILYIYYIDKKQTLKEKIMFKKIALAAALTASASFATWDYFPILDGGKGQAELDVAYFKIEYLLRCGNDLIHNCLPPKTKNKVSVS